ncbi:MAG: hypothetical protein UR56_C0005G0016 [Candidatus Roizmanbacteria bacterium GW2011_GWC2_34_23]|uniref:Uncharacterized protein n=1 Tax=Candidatus Roizmanbacteria bacterium GW2011_GWC2_34_23 TaxID=1618484 RepID=A0A0G0DI13_9BACT|nr:MAG: hypothetical protein UR56_C0005G0016 [Candidatus Roizmanbacteria bacterium GW2011_GWC2_34_23]
MTTWTHGLLAFSIYQPFKKYNWKKAVWWAIFPDLFWGIPLAIYLLISHASIPNDFNQAPSWFYTLYGSSHSFVIAFIVIWIVYYITKKFHSEMLAWPFLHILMDIPGHTYFQTPFLYPLSNFSIHGFFSWTDKYFDIASYAIPLLIISFTFFGKKLLQKKY